MADSPFARSQTGLFALIEQIRAAGSCSNPRKVVIVRRNEQTRQAEVFMPACKTWACAECADRNKHMWKHRVMHGVDHYQKQGKEFSFVTITLGKFYESREASILGWRKVWPRVYDRHGRACGKQPYCIIPECHRNGRVHLHLIIAGSVNERWWKDNVWGCGGGFIASSDALSNVGGAASYVTKYITKSIGLKAWPHKFKRIRLSHHWPSKPGKTDDTESVYSLVHPEALEWTISWLWRRDFDVRYGFSDELIEAIDLTEQ